MTKKILSIGQCGFDTGLMNRALTAIDNVTVSHLASVSKKFTELKKTHYDLILVNRIIDADGSSGLEVIKSLKEDPEFNKTPIMLISNYEHAQSEAVTLGAVKGFGKNDIGSKALVERLRQLLSD